MTLEELLEASADEIKSMTDDQLLEFFRPCREVTRPEFAPRKTQSTTDALVSPEERNQLKLKVAKLQALGIEVDEKALLQKLMKDRKK
jgi:hypothetical protein